MDTVIWKCRGKRLFPDSVLSENGYRAITRFAKESRHDNGMNREEPEEPDGAAIAALIEATVGSWKTQAIRVAAELRIADLLEQGPRTHEDLASTTRMHAHSLRRLLRALVVIGVCDEMEDGSFAITSMGLLLRSGNESLRSWAILWGTTLWTTLGHLPDSVRTGASARKLFEGTEGFEHLRMDESVARQFHEATAGVTRLIAGRLAKALDFSGVNHLVEVGGGYGEMLLAILEANRHMTGAIFDQLAAIEGARLRYEDAGLTARCEFLTGDFFVSVPEGGDLYLMKSVIHDWNDEEARVILENCRRAMGSDSRLMLIERILPNRMSRAPGFSNTVMGDLVMLVGQTGRERTKDEFRNLLESTGFEVTRILHTPTGFGVIEAEPI